MKIIINKPLAIVLALIGVAICAYVFRVSLIPYHKPPTLKMVDIEALQPGHMLPVETESLRYYVFKPISGEPYVLAVPLVDGDFYLPEQYWFKQHTFCSDFALETTNGIVDDKSVFHCRDNGQPDEWKDRWRWNALGKTLDNNAANKMADMYRVNFKRSGDELTFTGLASD